MSCILKYNSGTIFVETSDKTVQNDFRSIPEIIFDKRSNGWRMHCKMYRWLIRKMYYDKIDYSDHIKQYKHIRVSGEKFPVPYQYQTDSLATWKTSKWGVVVLPTGAGKSVLAGMCLSLVQRSTLILVPTIDLMWQWKKNMGDLFSTDIGVLGGGEHKITDITVSTYDSARIYIKKLATRFCFVVFDECHHLPSPAYIDMAQGLICPYRLGLTATPPDEPERLALLRGVSGDIVYSKDIMELSGKFLADYEIKTIVVQLTPDERELYDYHRGLYLDFRAKLYTWGFRESDPWKNFVAFAGRTRKGRQALKSFAVQKQLGVAASAKLDALRDIVIRHRDEQILIFTNDNKTGFLISALFFFPLITHETPQSERKTILERFKSKKWPYLVSSRVLNEGIDVPDAGVAVIVSGTATVREHVQRLGRILRKKTGKHATLYEIITEGTGEMFTSQKRRMHNAYA